MWVSPCAREPLPRKARVQSAAGSEIPAPRKAVLRGYGEQLGALASRLGLNLDEIGGNRLRQQ